MGTLAERHARSLGSSPLFYEQPITLERGEGVWLWDTEGKKYLDMYNNVTVVGHANPTVVDAVAKQMATVSVHGRYLHESVVVYAERLASIHAADLTTTVFACSGSEANEIAKTMAAVHTGKTGIITTDAAYHGNTPEIRRLTHLPFNTAPDPKRTVRSIRTPDAYRPLEPGWSEADVADAAIADLETQIARLEEDGGGFGGWLICPLFANEGLPFFPADFLSRAADVVHAAGGLVISDEVQAGFGRSGRMWGYEFGSFTPDIVTMGKPMGNGIPVSAAIASPEIVESFRVRTRYFNTFAGVPVQAAAGMAVLDIIEADGLVARADTVGTSMRTSLRDLHPTERGCVRGSGLFVGIEYVEDPDTKTPDPVAAAKAVEALLARGILLSTGGRFQNIVKIRPPLVFDESNNAQFLEAFSAISGQ